MIVIGADMHKRAHALAAVDAGTGRQRGAREIKAEEQGYLAAVRWARGLDEARVWASEDCRHVSRHFEQALIAAGERVVRVAPHRMGASRRGQQEPGKSDQIDALAIARAVARDGVERFPAAHLDPPAMEIRLLSDHRKDLVAERTRVQNRLRWHLLGLQDARNGQGGTAPDDGRVRRPTAESHGRTTHPGGDVSFGTSGQCCGRRKSSKKSHMIRDASIAWVTSPGPCGGAVGSGPGVAAVGHAVELDLHAASAAGVREPGDVLAHRRGLGAAPAVVEPRPGLDRERHGVPPAKVAVAPVRVHHVLLAVEGQDRQRASRAETSTSGTVTSSGSGRPARSPELGAIAAILSAIRHPSAEAIRPPPE